MGKMSVPDIKNLGLPASPRHDEQHKAKTRE